MAALMAAVFPATAFSQSPTAPPAEVSPVTTELRTQVGASYNTPGLQQSLDWSMKRLTRPGTGPMMADAHVSGGALAVVSPSYARVGVWGEYAPLSILTLRIGVEPSQYFGTFDSLMSFDRPDTAFDNDTRRERGGASAGRVLRLYATPAIRIRAGHLVATTAGDIERWSSSAPGPWFYEPTRDTLFESTGSTAALSRTVVLYEHVTAGGSRLGVGGLHTLQQVDGHTRNQVQRLGGIATLQSEARWHVLNRPALTLVVARYLDDPSKDGQIYAAFTLATTLRRR